MTGGITGNIGYQAPLTPNSQGNVTPVPTSPVQSTGSDPIGILQVDKNDAHVKAVQDHIDYLYGNNADVGLNDKQQQYIDQFKQQNPDYQ